MTINDLRRILSEHNTQNCSNDEKKEQIEQERLLRFMEDETCSYHCYGIKKEERPDFVLTGEKRIGVEVVELTTEEDKVFYNIILTNIGKGKTTEQAQKDAFDKHGNKANDYYYYDIGGSVSIGTGIKDINSNKLHFHIRF